MHEKIDTLPLKWDFFFEPLPLFSFFVALFLSLLIWLFWKKRDERELLPAPESLGATEKNLKKFYGWIPVIIGVHVAIPLLINGIEGRLFISQNDVVHSWANWTGLTQIFIALSLFYGGLTRVSAALLGMLWLLGIDNLGLKPMLSSIEFLGFAAFFYLAGRGPYSVDRVLFSKLEPNANYIHQALLFLRICVGINFIVYSFTERFANIPHAILALEQHPFLNFPNLSNQSFVLVSACLEMLAGLLIVLGAFPRTVSILTLICINASLTVSDWHLLVDYLPIYAAFSVFLIWEPHNPKQKLLWVEGMRTS